MNFVLHRMTADRLHFYSNQKNSDIRNALLRGKSTIICIQEEWNLPNSSLIKEKARLISVEEKEFTAFSRQRCKRQQPQ